MNWDRLVPRFAVGFVLICGCDVGAPLAPQQFATKVAATRMIALSEHPDRPVVGVIRMRAGSPVVRIGGNSSGCATTSLTTRTAGSSALINTESDAGLFVVFGMEGAGSTAPSVTGAPHISVQSVNYPLVFLRRHSSGKRANELWWIPPPSPTGLPMIFSVTASFSEPAYYHAMLLSVTGMRLSRPVRDDAFSSGPGSSYSTTVSPTGPQGVCVGYANGDYDFAKMSLHHYCAVGRFGVGYSWQQADPGSTTMAGIMSETGAPDWLHSVWEIAPARQLP